MGSIEDTHMSQRLPHRSDGPRDVFFFAHTRTASHVLCRLLSNQPKWTQSNYHFFHAFEWARKTFGWGPGSGISPQHRKDFEKLLQEGFEEIQQARSSAANEVCYGCRVDDLDSPLCLLTKIRTKLFCLKNTPSTYGNHHCWCKACGVGP